MEPGEGSAAPKATVALPGTDVNPAGRAPARLAVHCSLATGGPGAAMRHAPFGRPRHPLGTFPCGKVPRPPAGGRNLPQATGFLWQARERPSFLLPFYGGFRLCGGDQRAFRSPFGNLRALAAKGWRKKTDFLWMARERPSLLLPVLRRISPLRRRPKGFPLALWKPSGPYWLKRLRARKLNLSSSSFQQSDAVSGSYARLSSPGTRGVIAPVCTSASRCSGLVSNT